MVRPTPGRRTLPIRWLTALFEDSSCFAEFALFAEITPDPLLQARSGISANSANSAKRSRNVKIALRPFDHRRPASDHLRQRLHRDRPDDVPRRPGPEGHRLAGERALPLARIGESEEATGVD